MQYACALLSSVACWALHYFSTLSNKGTISDKKGNEYKNYVLIDSGSFERVEELKCLGTTLTNQKSIQEGIQRSLKSGNACYCSVQNLLSYSLLSKSLKIRIYRTIILPVVL